MPPLNFRYLARRAAVPLLLLGVTVLFYWKLTLTRRYTWLDSPDFAYQVLPWFQYQAGEWHAGRFPLWTPYEWAGQSLIGQAQPGAAYPLNWILFLLPLRHGWMRLVYLNWYWVLIHCMAVLFAYWFCRDLRRSRWAAALGGLAFGLGGWMGSTEWPQMLNGAVWMPLVAMFLLRTLRGDRCSRNAALAGAALGMAYLSGHHQAPTFIGLMAGGLWLYGLAVRRARLLGPLAAFAAMFVLVAALQALPAVEYGRDAVRWVGSAHDPVGWQDPVPYRVHSSFGLGPLSLIGIIVPVVYRHANPYIGVTILALALLGVLSRAGKRDVRLLLGVAIGGLLFALADYSLLNGILYAAVPLVEKARNPSMAIVVFHFAMAALAACGLDALFDSAIDQAWTRRLALALAAFGVFFAALLWAIRHRPEDPAWDRWLMLPLFALVTAAVFEGWRRRRMPRAAAAAALVLLALAQFFTGGSTWGWRRRGDPGSLLPALAQHGDVAEYLAKQPGAPRFEVDMDAVPYNFGDWYGMDAFDTYTASMPVNLYSVQADLGARMLLAARYFIGVKPSRPDQVEVFRSQSGLKVFVNPKAAPRVWTVHAVEQIPPERMPFQWQRGAMDLMRKAFVTSGPAPVLEQCGDGDRVSLRLREPGRVVVDAEMACPGMLVVSEPFAPGWQATLDGRPAEIREVYSLLRGVVVGAGTHRLEMRYRPRPVLLGAVCTAMGLLAAAVLGLRRGGP